MSLETPAGTNPAAPQSRTRSHAGGLLLPCLLLAALWVMLTEHATLFNAGVGVVVALLILLLTGARTRSRITPSRAIAACSLLLYFTWQLVLANLRMAYLTLAPLRVLRPGIVAVPLRPMSDAALTLLANMITLTPGTLSVEVSPDRRTLYVHAMEAHDPQRIAQEIRDGFERRVLEVIP